MSPPLGRVEESEPRVASGRTFYCVQSRFAAIVDDRWTEIETLNKRAKRFSVNSG